VVEKPLGLRAKNFFLFEKRDTGAGLRCANRTWMACARAAWSLPQAVPKAARKYPVNYWKNSGLFGHRGKSDYAAPT
jgi:hypothetical protein